MKRLVTLSLLFLSLSAFAEPVDMLPIEIPATKHIGMGGDHVAYTDNVYALLVNPAAILQVQETSTGAFSMAIIDPEKTFSTLTSIGDLIWYLFNGDMENTFDSIMSMIANKGDGPVGFDIREFPLSFAWVSNGLGVGIWNRIFMESKAVGSQIQQNLYADIILPISVAIPVIGTASHSLDIGVTFKPFARIAIPGGLDEGTLTADGLNSADYDTETIPLIAGTGIDAGLLYRWDIGFSLGFTVKDIITLGSTVNTLRGDREDDYYVPMTMNVGLAFDLKFGNFLPDAPNFLANTGVAVAVDWQDILTVFWKDDTFKYENIWQEANAGIQITLFDMFMLRGGMRKTRAVAGIGVKFASFQIDAAYSRKELINNENNTVPMLELTFAVRPKAKGTTWFWTQNPLIGYNAKAVNTAADTGGE
jgi:hypothetical protein